MEWEPVGILVSGVLSAAAIFVSIVTAAQQRKDQAAAEEAQLRIQKESRRVSDEAKREEERARNRRAADNRATLIREVSRQLDRLHRLAISLTSALTERLTLPPVVLASLGPHSDVWHNLRAPFQETEADAKLIGNVSQFFSLVEETSRLLEKLESAATMREFKPDKDPFAGILLALAGNIIVAQNHGKKIIEKNGSRQDRLAQAKREKEWAKVDEELATRWKSGSHS